MGCLTVDVFGPVFCLFLGEVSDHESGLVMVFFFCLMQMTNKSKNIGISLSQSLRADIDDFRLLAC